MAVAALKTEYSQLTIQIEDQERKNAALQALAEQWKSAVLESKLELEATEVKIKAKQDELNRIERAVTGIVPGIMDLLEQARKEIVGA